MAADRASDLWPEIEKLFHTCLDLDPAARRELLDRRRTGSPELVAEVESLLRSSGSTSGWIDDAFRDVLDDATGLDPRPAEGERIGPYRIRRELGEGGLGIVFLAERADQHYAMQVAIKVVKRGMDTREILRRSRLERQILADLDHPHIARLLDGGATDDGLPYFVMELVDGRPIDLYCREESLSLTARLRLFQKVCAAVHYAHQNLVVHRDVKPANILVTNEGLPKLLDFGIAKLLHPGSDRRRVAFTTPGVRLLTPEYASPEQVLGQALSTATDIYSLGVLLYRLLCERPPYVLGNHGPGELERVICEEDIPMPSAVAGELEGPTSLAGLAPRRLAQLLRGDLDNIVSKAMRKEPGRRYGSAEQLSRDIERFLRDQPVLARPDTLRYRSAKFIRRNRGPVAAVVLVFVVLVTAVIVTTDAARRARRAQETAEAHLDRAEAEKARAEQAAGLVLETFEVVELGEALQGSVELRDIDRLVERLLESGEQPPLIYAANLDTSGQLYLQLGSHEKAEPRLVEALEIRRSHQGVDPLDLATSSNRLGELYFAQGRMDEARELIHEALEIRLRALGPEHEQVAESLNNQGALFRARGESEKAEAVHREVLRIRRRLESVDPLDVANSLANLSVALFDQRKREQAAEFLEEALRIQQEELGPEHPAVAREMVRLATVYFSIGELDRAGVLFRDALEMQRRFLEPRHPQLAVTMNNFARLRERQERFEEAEALLRESLELQRQAAARDPVRITPTMNNLARLLVRSKSTLPEAEDLLREALRIRRRHLPETDERIAFSLLEVGRLLTQQGELAAAESHLREALVIRQQNHAEDHWRVAEAQSALGIVRAAQGRVSEAEALLRSSLELLERDLGPDNVRTLRAREGLDSLLNRKRSGSPRPPEGENG